MDRESSAPVRQRPDVPEPIRELVGEPDYVDAFTLTAEAARRWSPQRWAHATLAHGAGLGGQFIWRVLLCLRLAWRRPPDHIAGWRIRDHGDGWIRVTARSWMAVSELLFVIAVDEVTLVTVSRYRRRAGERVWTPLSAIHRRLVPDLLRDTHEFLLRAG